MFRKMLLCCLLLLGLAAFYINAKPYSYIKQTDFAAAYQSLITAQGFVIALPRQANYIDVYDSEVIAQSIPLYRLELSHNINAAAWVSGYLLVAYVDKLAFYTLNDNAELTLSHEWQNKTVVSLHVAGDYMVIQTAFAVELYKWQQQQSELLKAYAKPQDFYRAEVALDQSTLLFAWRYSYPMTEVRTSLVDVATLAKTDLTLSDVANVRLLSAGQFIYQSRDNALYWLLWQNGEWQQPASGSYTTKFSFQPEDALIQKNDYFYQYYNTHAGTLIELSRVNDTIVSREFNVPGGHGCLAMVSQLNDVLCLQTNGIRMLDWSKPLPEAKQQLVSFTEAFLGFARSGNQLYLYGTRDLRALTFDDTQAVDVLPALRHSHAIRDVLAINDKVIVESSNSYYTEYRYQQQAYQQQYEAHLGLGWEGYNQYQQANQYFMILNGRRGAPWFKLYPVAASYIMSNEPVTINWDQIQLPDNASIELVRNFVLADEWLIVSASVKTAGETYVDRLYAVPLELDAMQLAGPAVAIQSEHLTDTAIAYHQLAYYQGYLYLRQADLHNTRPIDVFQQTDTSWQHISTIDNPSCGSGTLHISEQLLVSAPGFLSKSSTVCLFELSVEPSQPQFTTELNLASDAFDKTEVASVGSYLLAGRQNDGRVAVFKKNLAPTIKQQIVELTEDSDVIVVAQAEDAESDDITLTLLQSAAKGTVSIDGTTIGYQPAANLYGNDQLTLRSADQHGNYTEKTLQLVITPVNDAPTLQNSSHTVQQDSTLTVPLTAQDVDGDAVVFSLLNSAANGTATLSSNGVLSYSAITIGQDTLQVQVTDPSGMSATATVTITVTAKPATGNNNDNQDGGGSVNFLTLFLLLLCCYRFGGVIRN